MLYISLNGFTEGISTLYGKEDKRVLLSYLKDLEGLPTEKISENYRENFIKSVGELCDFCEVYTAYERDIPESLEYLSQVCIQYMETLIRFSHGHADKISCPIFEGYVSEDIVEAIKYGERIS